MKITLGNGVFFELPDTPERMPYNEHNLMLIRIEKADNANRRALKFGVPGILTEGSIYSIYRLQRGRCKYCGVRLRQRYAIDHVMPMSRGGANTPENIVVACIRCDKRKGRRTPEEWLKR